MIGDEVWVVHYRKRDGKGTRLYAQMPTLPLAIEQFKHAKKFADRAGYTIIWIIGSEGTRTDFVWLAPEEPA